MKTRIIKTSIYKDINKLEPDARFLVIYLLTNEYIGLTRAYKLPSSYISVETGLSTKRIENLKEVLQNSLGFVFMDDWIVIPEIYVTNYNTGMTKKAFLKELDELPKSIKVLVLKEIDSTIDSTINSTINSTSKLKIINNKLKIKNKEKEKKEELKEVVQHWNFYHGTKYRSIDSLLNNYLYWRKFYSVEEIKKAVEKIKEDEYWRDKMTPVILLRQKNPRGEPVDYIGQLLNNHNQEKKEKKNIKNINELERYRALDRRKPIDTSVFLEIKKKLRKI